MDKRPVSNKLQAEIDRLLEETSTITKGPKWYEYVVLFAVVISLLAIGKYLL